MKALFSLYRGGVSMFFREGVLEESVIYFSLRTSAIYFYFFCLIIYILYTITITQSRESQQASHPCFIKGRFIYLILLISKTSFLTLFVVIFPSCLWSRESQIPNHARIKGRITRTHRDKDFQQNWWSLPIFTSLLDCSGRLKRWRDKPCTPLGFICP